jgi:L-lactate utilization protein LutC
VAVIPLRYGQADITESPAQLWKETATAASEHVAEAQLALIKIARQKNSRIGWIVLLSGLAELAALALLAVAVILILG